MQAFVMQAFVMQAFVMQACLVILCWLYCSTTLNMTQIGWLEGACVRGNQFRALM